MTVFRAVLAGILAAFALVGVPTQAVDAPFAAQATLPSDSVYHLDASLLDQDGQPMDFARMRGKPRVVSMFYTSCRFVCPLIIDTLKKTEHALSDAERARLDVLLISFDPDNDSPAALKHIADKRHLDTTRWRLARAEAADVRRLAAVLGIQYRQLQNHEFSHSSALVLLDARGRIVARTDRLGEADPEFVATIKRVLAETH